MFNNQSILMFGFKKLPLMKKIILFFVFLGIVACNRHLDTKGINAENRRANNSQPETREQVFSVLLDVYKPDYLTVKSHLRKVKRANPQEYYTTEGHRLYYELVGIAKVASKSDEAGLIAGHQKIQRTLFAASNLPDYQRLVVAAGTELIATRLLKANTETEKNLLAFYAKSLVEEQCTNYFLLYETFSKMKGCNYDTNEIREMANKTLQLKDTEKQSKDLGKGIKEKEFETKMNEQDSYLANYKKKLVEFL
jgi:IS1 family transposase